MPSDAVRSLRQTYTMTDAWVAAAKGMFLDSRHYDEVLSGRAVDVYKPNGKLLLSLRPKALPTAACLLAYEPLLRAAKHTNMRPIAAGGAKVFRSGTIGYLRGEVTAFTREDPDGWGRIQPLLRCMDAVFRRERPAEYAVLRDAADRTPPGLVIPGTSFTTVTANRTARTATHRDKGNLRRGYGVLTAIPAGEYAGGLLVFPKYRVAVDLRGRDVLIADNTEAHGNTAIVGASDPFERVSVIAYFHAENLPADAAP